MFGSHFYCYGNTSFPLVGISKGSIRTSGLEGCAQYGTPPLFVRCSEGYSIPLGVPGFLAARFLCGRL
jgi:hypothetical protein